jgi:hypothetical protein
MVGEYGEFWNPYSNSELPSGASTDPSCTVEAIAHQKSGCWIPYDFTYGGGTNLLEGPGWEDWADSFASYLYPGYHARSAVPQTNLVTGGIREAYVRYQIEHVHYIGFQFHLR